MNSSPLVTIIIPCYNHEKYIEKCIDSALAQTYKNIEIIVVNNGSTDNTPYLLIKYLEYNQIKLITLETNIPPGVVNGAFSTALKEAAGDYISLLCSDDWYMPEKIERQMEFFQLANSSVGLVYCHGYRYSEATGVMNKWIMGSERGYVFSKYLKKGDLVIPISPLVKKYCYEIIGIDHAWTGSEYDYFVMSQYVDFDYIDEHLVVMRDHDFNDGKNVLSVYKRVCSYNDELFSNKATLSRAGKLVSVRLSLIYLIFSRDFAEIGNRKFAKESFYKAFLCRPLCLFTFRGAIMAMYLILPNSIFFGAMKLARSVRAYLLDIRSNILGEVV